MDVRYEVDPARVRPHEVMDIRGSAERLRAETGWVPEIPLERTVADALEAWRVELGLGGEASSTAPSDSNSSRTESPAVTAGGGAITPVMMRSPGRRRSPAASRRCEIAVTMGSRCPPVRSAGTCSRSSPFTHTRAAPGEPASTRGPNATARWKMLPASIRGTSQDRSGVSATSSAGSSATIVRPSSPSSTATSGSATVGRPSVG